MYKYDLSIILPSYRKENWKRVIDSIESSVGEATWELIIVGPNRPEEIASNVRVIQDFGSPARCAQLALPRALGRYITWFSDDGIYLPKTLENALHTYSELGLKSVIIVRYAEGGNIPADSYWKSWTHDDQRLAGVMKDWKIAPVALMPSNLIRGYGGWDCSYEHLNMCCHDLVYRMQKDGIILHHSPDIVFTCDHTPHAADYKPVKEAYHENDLEVFNSQWSKPNDRKIIDINNWAEACPVWERRFTYPERKF